MFSFDKSRGHVVKAAPLPQVAPEPRDDPRIPTASIVERLTYIYVQHTPERFEFRQVAVGQTVGNLVPLTNGLRESNVSSFAALARCPDNEAVNE